MSYITYGDNNPQHFYHELYTKKQIITNPTPMVSNRFADVAALTIQTYVNKLRLLTSRDYNAFMSLVPSKLQQGIIDKHGLMIQTNTSPIWSDMTLGIILGATKYSDIVNNRYVITADAIHKSFANLI